MFLQGYVTAQDRLFQIDGLRRLAAGELSEVVGVRTIDVDRTMRRLRMKRAAEQLARNIAPQDQPYLAAYARGINYFIDTNRRRLPVEFALMQYDPKPWTLTDIMLVELYMFRQLTTSWDDELEKKSMLAGGEPKLVDMLFAKGTSRELLPGSNAWAISGKRSASGKPILANDPHLEWGLPSRWYMVHLKCPQMEVAGASIPGAPGVIVGHNRRLAWGVTNLHYDVQDLYIEKFDPRTGTYMFNGKPERAITERERILIKGQKPIEFVNWVTRHGPLWSQEGNDYLFLKWTATEPRPAFEFAFVDLAKASNWDQFRAALKRFGGPGQNFVYADVDGNIGYQATGRLPIRRTFDGDVPVAGTGEFEWEGYIPFEELPSVYNPVSGIIATANQNPFPPSFPYRVNGSFASRYRVKQIRDRLESKPKWESGEMLAIQKDVYSALHHRLAKETVAAYERRGKRRTELEEAINVLRQWDGQMDKGAAAPLLITYIYDEFRQAIGNRASGGKVKTFDNISAAPVMEALLSDQLDGWFSDKDEVLLRSLIQAVEEGSKRFGSSVPHWRYGDYLELTIRHPILGNIQWIGKYFNVGPVPLSGASTTVKQTSRTLGPSMRFVADLGDWERSQMNLTLGQSGQPFSPHYKDQWENYYVGKSFPLPFAKYEGDVLRLMPEAR